MVRRCAWGTCNADYRYPERLEGGFFVNFPKPKTNFEKCLLWIKACGRPHTQLNVNNIDKNKVVCSKHFIGGHGPSEENPHPIPADGSRPLHCRPTPKKRRRVIMPLAEIPGQGNILSEEQPRGETVTENVSSHKSVESQTDELWVSALDVLSLTAEIESKDITILDLEAKLSDKDEEIQALQKVVKTKEREIFALKGDLEKQQPFSVCNLQVREKKLKKLFVYFTGLTYVRFLTLLTFLVPTNLESSIRYESGGRDLKTFRNENGLLLMLCRLRHDFGLKDLAVRFSISLQSAGAVFNTWLDLFYFKFGQISLWPHRDVIISQMPLSFKKDYPTSLVIIDGTEFKTQTPCGLGLQSQMYSDYKSNTTLKALIGCDPRGSIIFISELFTGSISDRQICEDSGFFNLLKTLKNHNYIKDGDAVMADKGFRIEEELNKLGLLLNIPPFASSGSQMSPNDTIVTQKIAKHRVHIERVIRKVKTYKMLSNRIPTYMYLFQQVNKIWTVCCFLTLHQDRFVK